MYAHVSVLCSEMLPFFTAIQAAKSVVTALLICKRWQQNVPCSYSMALSATHHNQPKNHRGKLVSQPTLSLPNGIFKV